MNLEFQGNNWACSISAVVIFPVANAVQGEAFLKNVEARRRFFFDNYFRRVLPSPTGDQLRPIEEDERRGFVVFQRDPMQDVSFYTITPRLIMPGAVVDMPRGLTRRFWMTVGTPPDTAPGVYKGTMTICGEKGKTAAVPLEIRVRRGKLDPVDIPAGPFGYTIGIPWFGDDPAAAHYNQRMVRKSLQKMRDYGFTPCNGLPSITY